MHITIVAFENVGHFKFVTARNEYLELNTH